ncbi:MAG: DUF1772 domain-containing protein [Phycisphaerales bacterium JB037]
MTAVALAGLVGSGLVGGALFAFSGFVMKALTRMPGGEGARAMQEINRAVYTPWFMGPFFGTALLSLAAIVLGALNPDAAWSEALIAGGAMYAVGVFLVTAAGNVPWNNRLAGVDAEDAVARGLWSRYVTVWSRLNHVRVVASVGSVVSFGLAV